MGSGSSKQNAASSSGESQFPPPSSSNSAVVRRTRSTRAKIFHPPCLRSHDSDNDDSQVCDHKNSTKHQKGPCSSETTDSGAVKASSYNKNEADLHDATTNSELEQWGQSSFSDSIGRCNIGPRVFPSRSSNLSERFISRLNIFSCNTSFRLSRAHSSGSSRAFLGSSTQAAITNTDNEFRLHGYSPDNSMDTNEGPQGCDLLPPCFSARCLRTQRGNIASSNPEINHMVSHFSNNMSDDQQTASHNLLRGRDDTPLEFSLQNSDAHSHMNGTIADGVERRVAARRGATREPVERNVRFSRTLSVGRLRDRVLRRSQFADSRSCPLEPDAENTNLSQAANRRILGGEAEITFSERSAFISPEYSAHLTSAQSSLYGSQPHVDGISRSRDARYHDLLEHRSNFLERRRRIRSQVRALRRLGSRFENLSGHERSCILSGQHRTGQCSCRLTTGAPSSSDDSTARASLSRIVMLAEALFEVLDEIHQQSVVLSSRSTESAIGSHPAPREVVESLPVKFYQKSAKDQNEDVAQCYICLVEYQEEDNVRILPCNHEFHTTCIDKWLKEIHRVCPLCRGDICRANSLPVEN